MLGSQSFPSWEAIRSLFQPVFHQASFVCQALGWTTEITMWVLQKRACPLSSTLLPPALPFLLSFLSPFLSSLFPSSIPPSRPVLPAHRLSARGFQEDPRCHRGGDVPSIFFPRLVSEQRKRTANQNEMQGVFLLVAENHFTSQRALWWPESGTGLGCVTPTSSGGWASRGIAPPPLRAPALPAPRCRPPAGSPPPRPPPPGAFRPSPAQLGSQRRHSYSELPTL